MEQEGETRQIESHDAVVCALPFTLAKYLMERDGRGTEGEEESHG